MTQKNVLAADFGQWTWSSGLLKQSKLNITWVRWTFHCLHPFLAVKPSQNPPFDAEKLIQMLEKMLKSSSILWKSIKIPWKSGDVPYDHHPPHLIRRNPPAMLQGLSLGATHLGSVAVGDADLLDQTCLGPWRLRKLMKTGENWGKLMMIPSGNLT